MEYYFAPLEGITDMVYRRAHQKHYPGLNRYYTPFISPTQHHRFTPRELRELDPDNNAGVPLIPQLLGKNAEDFLWAARELGAMGYSEVNLNLGCPSGTVTVKGKGAGFLAFPDLLDRFLEEIFSATPVAISLKSRLGMETPEEFDRILEIYNRYPIRQLILHPRTRRDMYQGPVHLDTFEKALNRTALPLCYNGDLFTPHDCQNLLRRFPGVDAVMLGRGLVADPGMVARMGGDNPDKATLRRFHQDLSSGYTEVFGGPATALPRMKAIWLYMLPQFQGSERYKKALIKSRQWWDFQTVIDQIFLLPYIPEMSIKMTGVQ